ncbi:MAG: hypothetical protein P4M07_01105 [Xanthobacteraceae bacterium]|nr:hypothetical protein [Xanthobacteraceae bacterium]
MRIVIGPIIAALALAGALPAAAQSKPASDQAPVRVATTRDPAAERETYMQRARDEMGIWQQKLNDFTTRAEARGTAAQTKAMKALDGAWAETKAASARLEAAGAADWNSAKASYRSASHKLAMAWQKVDAGKK